MGTDLWEPALYEGSPEKESGVTEVRLCVLGGGGRKEQEEDKGRSTSRGPQTTPTFTGNDLACRIVLRNVGTTVSVMFFRSSQQLRRRCGVLNPFK